MWASSRNNVEKGVKAGLPYAFFQLAQYIHPGAWAQGKLDRLRKDLGEILDSPYADNLIGYYYDNESPEQIALASQVMSIVAEMDLKAGKRQRPIYILQGNPGRQLAYTDYKDADAPASTAADAWPEQPGCLRADTGRKRER
jgi:hypothetical protein